MTGLVSIFEDRPEGRISHVQIGAGGAVVAHNGHVDLGTGIETALAQIVAEELDVPLSDVRVVLGDTAVTPNQGPTIASETIQVAALPLRRAAAQLRHWLAGQGARRLNASPDGVELRNGAVCWKDTQVSFAALVEGQELAMRLDETVPVKDVKDYRIVGQPVGKRDLPTKVVGDFQYIQDVRIDGMLHGHVIRPPYAGRDSGNFIGRALKGYDTAAIAARPGFVAVVQEGDFLGVVAETPQQARALAEALPVDWVVPPEMPDLTDLKHALKDAPSTPRALDRRGDFDRGMAEAETRLARTYVWPYHLHGSIGPSCAIAEWNDGKPVIWSGTQNPHMLQGDLATLVGLEAGSVEIKRYQAAGCYGRNCADDVCGDALLMARAVGRIVRVQLTRAQETLWEPKGAAQLMEVAGGLKDSALHAYSLDTWYPSNRGPNLSLLLTGRISPEPRPSDMGDRTTVPPYRVPNKRITVHDMAPLVRAAWMRGVSALPNTFAHESYIDEMAQEAGEDPVAFRLKHLDDPRARELVQKTAAAAGWEAGTGPRLKREGRMAYGRGFAYATYVHGTFPGTAAAAAAWVCDVTIDTLTGEVTLTRVFVGQDQGLVINPAGVTAQINGNVIQTASRVLTEEVVVDAITPAPQSWASYPIDTFDKVPEIRSMLIERPEDPALGVGESAAVPAAAAIANAIFDATGVRLREAPFTPDRMRAGLAALDGPAALPAPVAAPAAKPSKLKWIAALAGAVTLGAVAIPMARPIPPQPAPLATTFSAETLERGRQVFAAGDCAVCHTAEGGPENAGGRPMETPFGTVYTTNLTPDPETGLGMWSFAAFERAMRKGISRDGHNLYPAFPYTAFAKIDGPDMQALYAYLQTLDPVHAESPRAQMLAGTNLRPVNAAWNLMFHDAAPFRPAPEQSEEWNRGKYLVEAAGHCSACHAPRNALGAEVAVMSGAAIDGWYAPPLQGTVEGWNKNALEAYLREGHAPGRAVASGPMAEVVASLKGLPDAEISAMATYLADLAGDAPMPQVVQPDLVPGPGSRLFRSACASCHEPGLPGMTSALEPLTRSAALRAPTPEALRTILAQGIESPESLDLRDMPGFGKELSAAQTDAIIAYLRARYASDLPAFDGLEAAPVARVVKPQAAAE
ncbi:molybdopterin cofactor-binding domain-containing protein [Pseudooceanicola aestuarii]|uniref:molybdopterin cofactor-binding domain-containing protein n=1 Tax=Pseudooceanicola aestuarii TaxID=2697319 RepID=UPI0013D83D25|nr:molybdopterin cofactor-binding domain-containing protein [Pseudooceanicola aestuarii]